MPCWQIHGDNVDEKFKKMWFGKHSSVETVTYAVFAPGIKGLSIHVYSAVKGLRKSLLMVEELRLQDKLSLVLNLFKFI